MSAVNENDVYIGFWYDRHLADGDLVWTMKRIHWRYFTNFLVIFTTFSAERLWFLIAYVIFQFGAHTKQRDGLRRSTDILIRNLSNRSFIAQYTLVLFHWITPRDITQRFGYYIFRLFPSLRQVRGVRNLRNTDRGILPSRATYFKSMAILFAAISIYLLGQISAIFTLPIPGDGRAVMLKPHDSCGIYYPTTTASFNRMIAIAVREIEASYKFYSDFWKPFEPHLSIPLELEEAIIWPELDLGPLFTAHRTTCPFHPDLCQYKESNDSHEQEVHRPYILDTGFISTQDTGINTGQYVHLRRVDVCAPLDTSNPRYYRVEGQRDESVHDYMYGHAGIPKSNSLNTTYRYSGALRNLPSITVWGEFSNNNSTDRFQEFRQHVPSNISAWVPIEEFWHKSRRNDISILFTAMNGVRSSIERKDPMFMATNSTTDDPIGGFQRSIEDPVSVIGCTHQIQVCRLDEMLIWQPTKVTLGQIHGTEDPPEVPGRCTAFDSIASFQDLEANLAVQDLDFTKRQMLLLQSYIMAASQWYSTGQLAQIRQDQLLLASGRLVAGWSTELEAKRWIDEIENILRFWYLGINYEFDLYVMGRRARMFRYSDYLSLTRLPKLPPKETDIFCKESLLVHYTSEEYASFRAGAYIIVMAVGLFIILLSYLLEPLLYRLGPNKLESISPKALNGFIAWNHDHILQIFRLAMEGVGVRDWRKGLLGDVPVSENPCRMAVLNANKNPNQYVILTSGDSLPPISKREWRTFEELDQRQGNNQNESPRRGTNVSRGPASDRDGSATEASSISATHANHGDNGSEADPVGPISTRSLPLVETNGGESSSNIQMNAIIPNHSPSTKSEGVPGKES